jgi:hypothetical protein
LPRTDADVADLGSRRWSRTGRRILFELHGQSDATVVEIDLANSTSAPDRPAVSHPQDEDVDTPSGSSSIPDRLATAV